MILHNKECTSKKNAISYTLVFVCVLAHYDISNSHYKVTKMFIVFNFNKEESYRYTKTWK